MRSKDGKHSVFKNKFGSYTVRFYDETGMRRSLNLKTATERDAFIRLVKRQEPLHDWMKVPGESSEKTNPGTVGCLYPEWIEHGRSVRKISQSCLGNYQAHFKYHILPVIGQVKIGELGVKDIEDVAKSISSKVPLTRSYVAVREGKQEHSNSGASLSKAYQREVLITLCMFGKWAFERGYIHTQPFKSFRMPPVPEQPYDYWRQEDEDQFFEWIEAGGWYEASTTRYHHHGRSETKIRLKLRNADEIRDMVLFALRSGMRMGEIGYLKIDDVNFEENWILVRGSYSLKEGIMKDTTKSNKSRYIEMNEDMREILLKHRKTPKHIPIFNINRMRIKNFSGLCKLAGVRSIHFHALRHTCLTNLANGYGMDEPLSLLKVQLIAGHSDIKTTQRYVHTEGVKGTSSRQWSRAERKLMKKN